MEAMKSISDRLEDIADTICREYCKHPENYSEEDEEAMEELYKICWECPVMDLM